MSDPVPIVDPAPILIVDDDPRNLLAAQAAFEDEGHELVLAHSGRHTPIIFVTAHRHDDLKVLEGYQLGAVDFLFKPIVPEVLNAKPAVFVELYRRTESLRQLERRAHERKLAAERQEWEAAALRAESARKDEFLAIVAHELRNPLTPIVLSLRLLRERNIDDPEFAPCVDAMDRQVRHLTRLVDDLLDIGRITSGKITLQPSSADLSSIVEQALETVSPLLRERAHHLELLPPSAPIEVDVDVDRIAQVVCNLVSNAARYTDPGGHIQLAWGTDDTEAWIRVRDDGRGISREDLPTVFDMFVQERQNGKGLGLALVKKLVDLHGGTVSAKSGGPGAGSTFEVRLPVRSLVVEPTPPPGDRIPVPTNTRILVVDDNDDVRFLTAELLRAHDLEVEVASDGRSAVEIAASTSPELILLDLGMPGTDGYATALVLRERLGDRTPPIVAVSGFGAPSDHLRTTAASFSGHLTKPVDPDVLLSTIGRLLRERDPSVPGSI